MEEESASWDFIQSLSTKVSNCSITAFKNIARLFKRNDIYYFLDALQNQSLDVWELPIKEKKRLVYYLELVLPVVIGECLPMNWDIHILT